MPAFPLVQNFELCRITLPARKFRTALFHILSEHLKPALDQPDHRLGTESQQKIQCNKAY